MPHYTKPKPQAVPVVSGDALALNGKTRLTIAEAAKLAHDTAEKIKAEYTYGGEAVQDWEWQYRHAVREANTLRDRIDALEAENARLQQGQDVLLEAVNAASNARDALRGLVAEAVTLLKDMATAPWGQKPENQDAARAWLARAKGDTNAKP